MPAARRARQSLVQPPYPARDYPNMRKRGADKRLWMSYEDAAGRFRWKRNSAGAAPKSAKSHAAPQKTKKKKMCVKQTTKRYRERPSPPFPANSCPGLRKRGNDKHIWASVANRNGVYRWKRE